MDKDKAKSKIEKKINDLLELNALYRGEIINHAIDMETNLEMIISYYFCHGDKKKAKELRHCLISNNMFNSNSKKNMFLFIIKNHYPNVKLDTEDFDRAINFRNQMAHGKLVFRSSKMDEILNFDNDSIILYEWKTKKNIMESKQIKLTRAIIDKEKKHIISVNAKLLDFFKIIKEEFSSK